FAVLAVFALVRFVGCASLVGIEDWDASTGPSPTQPVPGALDYPGTVKDDGPISYWRLQEPHSAEPSPGPTTSNAPVSGGIAADEMSHHNDGTYRAVILQQPPPSPLAPDSAAAPGGLTLQSVGLLEVAGQQSTSLTVDGGFVEVPFSNFLLNLSSFS